MLQSLLEPRRSRLLIWHSGTGRGGAGRAPPPGSWGASRARRARAGRAPAGEAAAQQLGAAQPAPAKIQRQAGCRQRAGRERQAHAAARARRLKRLRHAHLRRRSAARDRERPCYCGHSARPGPWAERAWRSGLGLRCLANADARVACSTGHLVQQYEVCAACLT